MSSAPAAAPDQQSARAARRTYAWAVARPLLVLGAIAGVWMIGIADPPAKKPQAAPEPAVETASVRSHTTGESKRTAGQTSFSIDFRAPFEAELLQGAAQALDALRDQQRTLEEREVEAGRRLEDLAVAAEFRLEQARDIEARAALLESRLETLSDQSRALRNEHARLQGEVSSLRSAPRPAPRVLVDRSPVARPASDREFHFEVRGDRVTYINLEALLEKLKTDARIQIRLLTIPRPIEGEAGPVGSFSILYQMLPVGIGMGSAGMGSRGMTAEFALSRWEIVPIALNRGETIQEALQPASDFGRAVNTLDPRRDTITLWVYPNGFAMYRRLRDWLHERGFLVAARPLPEGMAIRGSPAGSLSAGQ